VAQALGYLQKSIKQDGGIYDKRRIRRIFPAMVAIDLAAPGHPPPGQPEPGLAVERAKLARDENSSVRLDNH
jgi:hypothetical protein